jgi:long-chain acyl-CoA synthetase
MCDSVETEELRKNLLACRPTVMSSVPRMWEKVFVQVDRTVKQRPPIAQKIFAWAIATGRQKYLLENEHKPLPLGLKLKLKLADKIFMKVKTQAGIDRLRICHTGGGPIDPELIIFFGSIGIKLYQGFGLTETAPVTHTCTPLHHKLGWVGRPIPNTFVKIAEDGEILIKGPQVMKGYLNNPEANKEAFTADGYFRTGDIGEVDPEGYMKITDRKKDLIITSGGKNIAPQIIENSFNTDPYIEQVYVTGEKRKYIAGLVVPNYQNLEQWAKEKGISFSSKTDLIANEKVKAFIKERIDKVNSTLSKYETIKHFAVLENEFTEAGGELTPTLKRKRKVIEAKYKDVIETLYPQDKN